MGQNSSLGDEDLVQQLVQLLIVGDGEHDMPWDDPLLLVVSGCVASQLHDLSSEILQHGGEIDRGLCTNQLGVVSFAKISVDSTDRESKTGLA